MVDRLLEQKPKDKNKRYSLYAPKGECIGRSKVHERYGSG
jgi:hypothetical protein